MARKKITPEELRQIQRKRKIKQKAKNCKPGPDAASEVPIQKADDLCAICDDGGDVTYCDGGCQRCFHLDKPKCRLILGLDKGQAKMIHDDDKRDFICKNCKYKQHQCFACGKLGSSDLSSGAQVFRCKHNDCVRFYHPECVAKLLYPEREKASPLQLQISAGEEFNCPIHQCSVCKGGENKDDQNMQFAVCRRCPTAYHRKCLPSDILFEPEKGRNGHVQRAWEEMVDSEGDVFRLYPIVIYCTKHEIVKELGTPKMNHIIFPKIIREPKVLVAPPIEEDICAEEELPDHPSSEPSKSPPSDQNKCSCSSPLDSFAPSSLFPHPHPGSGGWLED